VGVPVAYNFQIGNNKIKWLSEYESEIEKVLLFMQSTLQNAKQFQHARILWHVRCPRDIQTLPGFDQHLSAKCSVLPLLFGAEYYQSLEIALTKVG
jgi:hypothetical protein